MIYSDPVLTRPDQMGQMSVYLNDPEHTSPPHPLFPTGRLHECPAWMEVTTEWADLLPDDDQVGLFQDVYLQREPLLQFVPSGIIGQWIATTQPLLAHTTAHFKSRLIGGDLPPEETLPLVGSPTVGFSNIRWYLFYGNAMFALQGIQFLEILDQPEAKMDQISQLHDSYILPTGDEAFEPLESEGWTLVMLRKRFTLNPANLSQSPNIVEYLLNILNTILYPTPLKVEYQMLGAWAMDPHPGLSPDLAVKPPIFDPTRETIWKNYHNPLNWPLHTVYLTPWQP